jgi:hypothetical protein
MNKSHLFMNFTTYIYPRLCHFVLWRYNVRAYKISRRLLELLEAWAGL